MLFSPTKLVYPLLLAIVPEVIGQCREPGPAFPPPQVDASLFESSGLAQKFNLLISDALNSTFPSWSWENSSFAIQLTSGAETLWSSYYTAPSLGNYSDGSPTPVSGDTAFRIASISKSFTVYALLLENAIGLEDRITKYLPQLKGERDDHKWGTPIDWDSITIRTLASQLSGIGRGNGNPDLATFKPEHWDRAWDPISSGLPPISQGDAYLKPCMNNLVNDKSCTRAEIFEIAKNQHPVFSPNDRSTYSNMAFTLLGLVLENATAQEFPSILQSSILDPLKMTHTTTVKPNDSDGIIPVGQVDWFLDMGPDNPTGGIYSTANDLSKYLRSILNSELLPKTTTDAWMKPHSWTSSRTNSAYGMPWEILRTTKATPDSHPVDIITKGGSLGGYFSNIALLPEYGIGLTILTATPSQPVVSYLKELLISALIPSFDQLARAETRKRYSGSYGSYVSASDDDSMIELGVDDAGPGLLLKKWTLNNTDFLPTYGLLNGMPEDPNAWEARLIPANLVTTYDSESSNPGLSDSCSPEGYKWLLTAISKPKSTSTEEKQAGKIFDDFCVTDVDGLIYGGWSLEDFTFVSARPGAEIGFVWMPGSRKMLFKKDREGSGEGRGGWREGEQMVLMERMFKM